MAKDSKSKVTKPVKGGSSKPVAKKPAPKAKVVAKPAPKKAAAPAKAAAKPAAKKAVAPAKPVAKKPVAKAKPELKKPVAKAKAAPAKPVAKKAVAKPAAKAAPAKAVAKPVAKPVAKAAKEKPVAKAAPVKPVAKVVAPKAVAPVKATSKEEKKPAPAPEKAVAAKETKVAPVKEVKAKAVEAPKAEAKKAEPKKEMPPVKKVAPVITGMPVAKPVVPVKEETEPIIQERVFYSKEDLEEFRVIITEKLVEAKQEFKQLSDSLKESNEMAADGYNLTEFGSDSIDKEQNEMFLVRQKKFIQQLEAAMIRIENGSYGRCKVTGKLIPKERLRLVPHTESSMEAKLQQRDAPRVYPDLPVASGSLED